MPPTTTTTTAITTTNLNEMSQSSPLIGQPRCTCELCAFSALAHTNWRDHSLKRVISLVSLAPNALPTRALIPYAFPSIFRLSFRSFSRLRGVRLPRADWRRICNKWHCSPALHDGCRLGHEILIRLASPAAWGLLLGPRPTALWHATPCSLCFGGMYYLHVQGSRISQANESAKNEQKTSFLRPWRWKRIYTKLDSFTSRRIAICVVTVVRTSNPKQKNIFALYCLW
jgi:hypothetical protein